ncbi:MAG: hypothetical protein LRY72_02115, partial [Saccharospirillaceae bacterium]|nr:hypothetical protein [Saccharospirillaceae bacterium]
NNNATYKKPPHCRAGTARETVETAFTCRTIFTCGNGFHVWQRLSCVGTAFSRDNPQKPLNNGIAGFPITTLIIKNHRTVASDISNYVKTFRVTSG